MEWIRTVDALPERLENVLLYTYDFYTNGTGAIVRAVLICAGLRGLIIKVGFKGH